MRNRLSFASTDPSLRPRDVVAAELRSLLDDYGRRSTELARQRMTLLEWLPAVPESRGPLDLVRYAFQVEPLYSDRAVIDHEQVHVKATQIGWSTGAIRQALFHADVLARSVLYTFPTENELRTFSRKRIRPVLRGSEYLRSRMPADAVDNVTQKQIGQGWVNFGGLNKPIDSLDVDVLIIDEYDTSDQAHINATEYRLSGAESADLRRRIGVPSIPGFGIDAFYEASDKRAWTVRCEACNHWNRLVGFEAFEQNVDQERVALVCSRCRKLIDVRYGEWVPEHPDREIRGYHAPKMLVPGRRVLERIIKNSQKTRPDQVEDFHRRDLGQAWAPSSGRLSLEAVKACVRPDLRLEEQLITYNLTTMGVDMASARDLNVTIEEEVDRQTSTGRKVFVGTISTSSPPEAFKRLCELMELYAVNMCGIDNEPDGMFSKSFAARYPGRVYRMDFFTPQAGGRTEPHVWNVDDQEQFCSMWRTKVYDATFERYRLQRVLLPPLEQLPEDFPKHLGNLYRRRTEPDDGTKQPRIEYVRTGPEDYAQCEAYNLAAIELYWRNAGLVQTLGSGPVPLLSAGEETAAENDADAWAYLG